MHKNGGTKICATPTSELPKKKSIKSQAVSHLWPKQNKAEVSYSHAIYTHVHSEKQPTTFTMAKFKPERCVYFGSSSFI